MTPHRPYGILSTDNTLRFSQNGLCIVEFCSRIFLNIYLRGNPCNTNGEGNRGADITIHAGMHANETSMTCLYRSDWNDAELGNPSSNQIVPVKYINGRATVRIDLPPAGMAIFV